jgi:hypothetical protein
METIHRLCDYQIKSGRYYETCGKDVEDTTRLVIRNETFFVDLCTQHFKTLQEANRPFTDVANDAQRRTGTAVRKAIKGKKGTFTTKEVREWLRAQGRDVPDSGRLPATAIEEYQEANG